MIWHKIDLDAYFDYESKADEIERISNTPVNINMLSLDDRLNKLAKEDGRERDDKYSDEVGL